jgi:hypothetical protein
VTPLTILAGVAVTAWLVAVAAALRLMAHRLPGRSVGWYAVRGYAFFDPGRFAPSGRATQRVFLLAAVIFLLAVIAGIAVAFGSR